MFEEARGKRGGGGLKKLFSSPNREAPRQEAPRPAARQETPSSAPRQEAPKQKKRRGLSGLTKKISNVLPKVENKRDEPKAENKKPRGLRGLMDKVSKPMQALKPKAIISNIKAAPKAIRGKSLFVRPVKTSSGKSVSPVIKNNQVIAPKVIEPIKLQNTEIDEDEYDEGDEMMEGEDTIEAEITDEGDVIAPELVEEEGADGESKVYLRFHKIPAKKDNEGNVIMPFKAKDGTVVTTDEIYTSATGEIYTNADGDVVIENANGIVESLNIKKYIVIGVSLALISLAAYTAYKIIKNNK